MGIAYTDMEIQATTLRADTTAHFTADLRAVLEAVGWVHSVLVDGDWYHITSPQGLEARLYVRVLGDAQPFNSLYPFITLQFKDVTDTIVGYEHKLAVGPAFASIGYEIIAGVCQVFIALAGQTTETYPSDSYAFCGGIPFVPNPQDIGCVASSGEETTTSIWWSSGKRHPASSLQHFRSSRYAMRYFDYMRNGTVHVNDGLSTSEIPYTGTLQMYPLTMTEDVDFWAYPFPEIVKYGSDDPLYIHPFIGWDFSIRGQIWDAFLATKRLPLDTIIPTSEVDPDSSATRTGTWKTWNYYGGSIVGGIGTHFATLCLLTEPPEVTPGEIPDTESNYAY